MKEYVNRRTVAIFLLIFFCLSVVACGGITAAYAHSVERGKSDYMERLESETDRVFDYLTQSLMAGVNVCNGIFTSKWYEHHQNVAGVYDDEFDGIRRIEIQEEIQGKVIGLPLASNILVITPAQNQVICKEGWFTLPMYKRVYNTVTIDTSMGLTKSPTITVNDNEYCALVLQDSTSRKYKSVICLLIARKTFEAEARKMLSAYATDFEARLEGELLTSEIKNRPESENIQISRLDSGARLDMTFLYKSYEEAVGRANRWMYVGMMVIMLTAVALFSFIITLLFVRPVNRMILQFGGEAKDLETPYQFIYEYVDGFAKSHARLSEENEHLRKDSKRFLSLMRNEIILGMLTNPTFNFGGDYIHSAFPWMAEGKPFLLAVCQDKRFSRKQTTRRAEDYCTLCENSSYASIDQESWFLFWFEDDGQLEAGRSELQERLQELLFVISEKMDSTSEMHGAYLRMKAELEEQCARWRELPMLLSTKLVSRIYANKREEVSRLIEEACCDHSPEAVFWLLARISSEQGFDMSDDVERYRELEERGDVQEQTDALRECALTLCKYIHADKQTIVSSDAGREICRYIEAHYQDAELSVNQLAEIFSMHRTLISKAVKAETGETFTDYLLRLRINRATALLRGSGESISLIAERVGIPNYATFKRGFVRIYGCSPKEWREKV